MSPEQGVRQRGALSMCSEEVPLTTYYLDNSSSRASDSNAGTSADTPFASLSALNSRTFRPGDVISIKAGTSYNGTLTITADGTAVAPVTFNSYGAGAKPIISTSSTYAINLNGANHVVLDGLDARNAANAGVNLTASSNNNIVRNMDVSKVAFGIWVEGQHNLFTGNAVHDLKMWRNTQGGDDDTGAIGFGILGSNNEFAFNKIWNAKAQSYDYGSDGGGFETWRSVSNTKIHDNWVQDSSGFFEAGGLAGDRVVNISLVNNVSLNNGGFHWLHNREGVGNFGIAFESFKVAFNTIIELETTEPVIAFGAPPEAGSYEFHHNLVYAPNTSRIFNQSGDFHTDNFYTTRLVPTGEGEKGGDPMFVSLVEGDFYLRQGSPAAGTGASRSFSRPISCR
jgi:hypothetical protein